MVHIRKGAILAAIEKLGHKFDIQSWRFERIVNDFSERSSVYFHLRISGVFSSKNLPQSWRFEGIVNDF